MQITTFLRQNYELISQNDLFLRAYIFNPKLPTRIKKKFFNQIEINIGTYIYSGKKKSANW